MGRHILATKSGFYGANDRRPARAAVALAAAYLE